MTEEEWASMEEEWAEKEIARLNRVRVSGYLLACCNAVSSARKNVDAALDRLERARRDAEHARARLVSVLEQAELAARVHDEDHVRAVALCLEELFG